MRGKVIMKHHKTGTVIQHDALNPKGASLIRFQIMVVLEGKTFVGHVPALDVVSQGKTMMGAIKNATAAAILFLEECAERRTLPAVLASLGWTRKGAGRRIEYLPPTILTQLSEPIRIPA